MSELPLVSIVTPSFNQAQFLETTIRSVLKQDYPRIEYIICDGGSTDGSVDIIQKYEDRIAFWVSEKDKGQTDAINKGFCRATGQIFAWLNSDDVYLPGCVSTIMRFLNNHPEVGMAFGNVEIIDAQGRILMRPQWGEYGFVKQLTQQITIPQPAAFFRRKAIEQIGYLRTDLHYAFDFDLWLQIGRHYPIRRIGKTTAQFRLSDNSKSVSQTNKWGEELIRILDDLYAEKHLTDDILKLKRKAYTGAYLRSALCALAVYDMASVRKSLRRAAIGYPMILIRTEWWASFLKMILGQRIIKIGRLIKKYLRRLLITQTN
jgi:glycosyltransferase involved in cell wall biosynthesis